MRLIFIIVLLIKLFNVHFNVDDVLMFDIYFRLRIKSFRAKDAGVYTCQNEEDKSREMSVTIKHKPDLGSDNIDGMCFLL